MKRSPTVVYIVGWGRSGSTLIGNLLNEVDGITHLGEVRRLWETVEAPVPGDECCGCGDHIAKCQIWGAVLPEVLGRTPLEAAARSQRAYQHRHFRLRHTWYWLRHGRAGLVAS